MVTCHDCEDSNSFMVECLGCNKVLCVNCIAKGHNHGLRDEDSSNDDNDNNDLKETATSFIDDIKNLLTRND